MKTSVISVAIILLFICCKTNRPATSFQNSLFRAADHTAENLFSKNIEGPAVDNERRLFVVNYQRDGTIGLVNDDGTCELFVELPVNSTGNSIQFNKEGNMFVADFTGHNILAVDSKTKAISVFCHEDAFNQPNDIILNKKGQIFASDPN
ncbi:MAG: SMP-30/gluconolactonase/LRE family protein, partial [Chitinophagaceae bacterium]